MASIKTIHERKYKITVSNGYHADGRKISRAKTITVPDRVRTKSIPQYVAHAAEEFEREVKLGYSEDGELSFEEYAERWLARQTKYAPSTLASYRRMLAQTYPHIGQIKLNRLRPIALENMLMELRKRTHHGKTVQEATVQKYLTVVSAVLSDAKRNEIIQKNPARMIDLPATEKANQQIPTPEEAKRLLEILTNEPEEYKLFYALAIYTGCRRGELCALRWSDFTCIGYDGILTVQHSRSSVLGQGIAEGTTKNGKARTIYLYDDMMSLLCGYGHYKLEEAKQNKRRFSEYLFVNADGTHMHPDTFTKRLRIIDSCTKELLGWVLSESLEIDFVLETVEMVIRDYGISLCSETLVHSDQGCHYTSVQFRQLLKDRGLRQSMSRRANCWDNAPQESFFGHMKDEIDISECSSFHEIHAAISDWVDYYNNDRCQWDLAKLSPREYYSYLTTGEYPLHIPAPKGICHSD